MKRIQICIKRIFDLLLASILSVILLPLLLIISILVYYKLGSPIIFTHVRPGKNGLPFTMYKFRTMLNQKAGESIPGSKRLTPFGKILRKTSLDELPELINVIKGDMSFVGPRPLLMEYLGKYKSEQARRHEVKPGITGWAQVNGRNSITWEEKFKLDVWYVDNWNIGIDFMILLLTISKVIKKDGINQDGRTTMDRFEGSKVTDKQSNLLEYFENTLLKYRSKKAVIDEKQELNFQQLEIYSKRLSFLISKRTNNWKKPIVVFLPNSVDSLVAFLGVLYSGNFYVPIDVKSHKLRIKSIIKDLGKPLIITSYEYCHRLESVGIDTKNIIQIEEAYNEDITYNNSEIMNKLKFLVDLDPCFIIYTSGSIERSKGGVISHRSVIDYIDWVIGSFDVSNKEIIGNQFSFNSSNSILDIYLCFATGATLVIIPEQYFNSPVKLMEYINFMKINFIFWNPNVMLNIADLKLLEIIDARCLKKVIFDEKIMSYRNLNYLRIKLPDSLFAILYGINEITINCIYYIINKKMADNNLLPIGKSRRNTDILILNQENRLVKKYEIGELCIRGSSLALGYWNDFNKTNKILIQNPLNKNYTDRIYRTGHLVCLNEENEIIFIGRKDTQIKQISNTIVLREIKNAGLSLNEIHKTYTFYNKKKKEITLVFEGNKKNGRKKIAMRSIDLMNESITNLEIDGKQCSVMEHVYRI